MTRNKRTGLVPGKKFFTSVGGVGSRNIAMHNKILSQASMPRPAPGPTETNKPQVEIKLFNISTFGKKFTVNGDGNPNDSGTALENEYLTALTNAAKRWEIFLKLTPEMTNAVKIEHTKKFLPKNEWRGIELLNLKYDDGGSIPNSYAAIDSTIGSFNLSSLRSGFGLILNKDRMNQLTTVQKSNVLAHELGHVLGLTSAFGGIFNNGVELFPKIVSPDYYPKIKYLHKNTFKGVWLQYSTYTVRVKDLNRFAASYIDPYVPLSNDLKHWRRYVVERRLNATSEILYTYPGMYNELMGDGYDPAVDDSLKYLISKMSISFLVELHTFYDNAKINYYDEINPGNSEVQRFIKSATNDIILSGEPGVSVSIKELAFYDTEIIDEKTNEILSLFEQIQNRTNQNVVMCSCSC